MGWSVIVNVHLMHYVTVTTIPWSYTGERNMIFPFQFAYNEEKMSKQIRNPNAPYVATRYATNIV